MLLKKTVSLQSIMKLKTMKKLLLLTAIVLQVLTAEAQSVRETILLDKGWKFMLGHAANPKKDFGCGTEYFNYLTKASSIHNEGPYVQKFDDSSWQEVQIPHDWVATLPYASEASHSHGYKTVGWKYPETSVGWYRKTLTIPAGDLGKRLLLRFDGIFRNATVWFNGFYMGTEPSGYATQVYDITPYVKYGEQNLICVRADASLEEGWFYEGAGIYRDVCLEKMAEVSVAPFGTFVYAELQLPYSAATINVETEVHNASLVTRQCEVIQRLLDAEGREVCKSTYANLPLKAKQTRGIKQQMALSNPHLWSTTDPYLYKVETTVKVDGKVTDVYETTTGLRDIKFDAEKGFLLNGKPLKPKGVNMHQDHAGVGAAIPDALQAWRIKQLKKMGCNAYRASHNPMTPALLDICDREGMLVIDENRLMGINDEHLRLLERMIKRDRNHPSIILWSDGNEEWGLENNIQGTRLAEAMREYTRLFDPTRPSTVANAGGTELIKGLDVVGFNYIVQNDVDNRKKNNPLWKIVGTEETSGCGTRGWYFKEENYKGRMVSLNRTNEQNYENIIERGWKFYAERPWAAGLFYWTGFDYRGEPNPLSYPAHDSEFGIFDYCGFPKDEAYYLKAWWTEEPVLHIFPHWNLQGHEGEEVELWAYSNCDEVELIVNGKKLGRQQMPKNGHLKWKAVYQPGKVVAYGYKNGKRTMTQTIETTKEAYKTVLKTDRQELTADGRDVAVVTVEVQDQKGSVVPDACPLLTFTLEGNGRILGAGNGDPMYLGEDHPKEKECRQFTIPAFNGLAQVLVQSGEEASTITLRCEGEKLQTGSVSMIEKSK
jgi:beta-galactosidase